MPNYSTTDCFKFSLSDKQQTAVVVVVVVVVSLGGNQLYPFLIHCKILNFRCCGTGARFPHSFLKDTIDV